ncbi:MAG: hypothetical protein R6V84_11720 [Desulfobacterales bacterium]
MTVSLMEVRSGPDLKAWVKLPLELYRGDPLFIPQLTRDEIEFFKAAKNPSFGIADTRLILALKEERPAGRVCGIINHAETEKLGYRRGRFGWFECIDDPVVAQAMLGHLEAWFVRESCREMTGPHGFTDLDPEGMLVEGFEAQPTIAGSYNKPYYRELIEALGFEKEVDYIETRIELPRQMPPLFQMMEKKVLPAARADGYRLVEGLTKRMVKEYAGRFWDVLEASFEHLYGVTPLSREQRMFYQKKYFGFIDPRFMQFVVDGSDKFQGFFLGLPSLSRPFQRARGRLWPLGFLHILRGFKVFDTVDFYFAGVHPQANSKKVLPVMAMGMWHALQAAKVQYLETNRELETNTGVVGIWSRFNVVSRRRSRIFRKILPAAA